VFDGDSARSERKARLCNLQQRPGHLVSSGPVMFLRFRSDASGAGRGFHVVYTAICSNVIRHQPRGVIESPNFPEPYPSNANCSWTIEALMGNNISLAFSTLEIEHEANCSYDYLEVNETDALGNHRRLGRYCGEPTSLPAPLVSSKPVVHLHFVTDGSQRLRGFRIEYTWQGCGSTLTKPRGSLQTPNYPYGYPHNTECLWHIQAPLGQRVHLTFVDVSMETASGCPFDFVRVHGGPDLTSPVITEICGSSTAPRELTSHGDALTIHFRSDSSIEGKGLRANYRFDASGAMYCVMLFFVTHAFPLYAGEPVPYVVRRDLLGHVTRVSGHVTRVTCPGSLDRCPGSLDTRHGTAVLASLSGVKPVLSLAEQTQLKSPSRITLRSHRQLSRVPEFDNPRSFPLVCTAVCAGCGATLDADKGGAIATVDYPYFSSDTSCSWVIRTAQAGERVTLTPTHLSLPEGDCFQFNVTVRDGDTADAPLLDTLCSARVPPTIVSRGGALYVHACRAVFRATYGAFLSDCGATITSLAGSFASPDFPDSYPHSRDCVWTLSAASGNMMSLTFSAWDLEESEFCNKDYVEIREKSAAGTLFGRFCGSSLPGNLSMANGFWIKFHSDDDGVAGGFRAQFETAHKVELKGMSGVIESPLYPREDVIFGAFAWTVRVPDGTYPRISWSTFSMYPEDCDNRFLQVHCTSRSSSSRFGRLVGRDPSLRPPFPFLRIPRSLDSHRSSTADQLSFMEVARNAYSAIDILNMHTTDVGCPRPRCILVSQGHWRGRCDSPAFFSAYLLSNTPANSLGRVSPSGINIGLLEVHVKLWCTCTGWTRVNRVLADWPVAPAKRCRSTCVRSVPVSSFFGDPDEHRTGTRSSFAKWALTEPIKREVSIWLQSGIVFFTECGGNLTEGSGVLADTDVIPSEQNCRWLLRSDRRRRLKITIEVLDMPSQDGACRDSFLQVLNGAELESPPLGQGKFCGSSSTLPELPETTSHQATVVYKVRGPFKGRFRLRWQEASTSCGGPVTLTAESPEATVSSPGNPHGGPAHSVQCDWRIQGPSGRRIRVDFPDAFHMPHGCHEQDRPKDYVEFLDGGTANAASLGMFCGSERGDSLLSSDNLLAVRYVQTGPAGDYLGFRATVSLAECGGTLWPYSAESKNLQPVRAKLLSGAAFDCEWMLRSTDQTSITLTIRGLDLRDSPTCTGTDFIEVRDGNKTGGLLYRMCGANISTELQSAESSMYLRVKTATGPPRNGRSLVLRWQYQHTQCGGELGTPEGSLSSPGFPEPLTQRRHCRWTIQAPEGRRISLRFTAGDLSDCTGVVMV
ncbi:unnamed protein product, partial [Ixodes hexagonus]